MKDYRLKIALILGLSLLWLVLPATAWGQGIYKLTINVEGDGTVTKTPSKTYYDDGEVVNLLAQAGGGFIFSNWSGDLTGSANPTNTTMDGEKTITAHFSDSGVCTLTITFHHNSEEEPPYGTVAVEPRSDRYGDEHTAKYDYAPGTEVTLAAEGRYWEYDFWYWAGDIYSHDNPLTITMNSDMFINPVWIAQQPVVCNLQIWGGNFYLEMPMEDGSVIGSWADAGLMPRGTTMEIKADDRSDYDEHFTHWSGPTETDTEGIADMYSSHTTITVCNQRHYVYANFEPNSEGDFFTLTIEAVRGRVNREPQKAEYEKGEEVQLTAVPDQGYDFLYWEGSLTGHENPTTIIMDSNKSIRAVFETPKYSLELIASHGTINVDPDKELYHEGTTVDLEAVPSEGYAFKEWEGALTGSKNPTHIIMEGEELTKTITAVFEEAEGEYDYTLEVVAEYGIVLVIPDKRGFNENEIVHFLAQRDEENYPDYNFVRWEGALTGSVNPISLFMQGEETHKVVTAIFESSGTLLGFTLNITAENGVVTKIPDLDRYESGMQVTLLATPNSGCTFTGWSGGLSGMGNPVTITMDSHKNITANFSSGGAMLGDVTGNGEITSYDASLAAQYSIQLIDFTPDQFQAADVTGNGDVSSYDASLIAQYSIGLIDGF